MPRGPKGEKQPADVVGGAIMVGKITKRNIKEGLASPELEKNPEAVVLGRRGGRARAAALSKQKRSQIARKAAKSRWKS
jgi:hypothetical protein